MMKRIMRKLKLILVGALVAALSRVKQELEDYLEGEQGQAHPCAKGEGGEQDVCSGLVQ